MRVSGVPRVVHVEQQVTEVGEHQNGEHDREPDVHDSVPPASDPPVVVAGVDEVVAERGDAVLDIVPHVEVLDLVLLLPRLVAAPAVLPDAVGDEQPAEHQAVAPDVVLYLEELREGHPGGVVHQDPQRRARQAEQEDGDAREPDRLRAVDPVVDEVAHTQFDRRDHRGQRGKGKCEEEDGDHQQLYHRAAGSFGENLRQNEEGDCRASPSHSAEGVIDDSEHGHHHGQTRNDADAVVGQAHRGRVQGGVLVLAHVHRVGDCHAHARRAGPGRLRESVYPGLGLHQVLRLDAEHVDEAIEGSVLEVHHEG